MKIELKRVDKTLSLPTFKSKDSLKIELVCRKDTIIEPKDSRFVPLNIIAKIPKGYVFIVAPLEIIETKGLIFPRGVAILDSSDSQDEELKFVAYNFTDERIVVLGGEVIACGVLVKAEKISPEEKKGK